MRLAGDSSNVIAIDLSLNMHILKTAMHHNIELLQNKTKQSVYNVENQHRYSPRLVWVFPLSFSYSVSARRMHQLDNHSLGLAHLHLYTLGFAIVRVLFCLIHNFISKVHLYDSFLVGHVNYIVKSQHLIK